MYRLSYIISVLIVVIITTEGEFSLVESNDLESRKISGFSFKNARFLQYFFRPVSLVFTSTTSSIFTTTIICTTSTRFYIPDCYSAVFYSFNSLSVPGYFRFRALLDLNEDNIKPSPVTKIAITEMPIVDVAEKSGLHHERFIADRSVPILSSLQSSMQNNRYTSTLLNHLLKLFSSPVRKNEEEKGRFWVVIVSTATETSTLTSTITSSSTLTCRRRTSFQNC